MKTPVTWMVVGGVLLWGGCAQVGTGPKPAGVPAPSAKVASAQIAQFLDDRMTLALSLTPPERQQVHAINLKYAQKPEAAGRQNELKAVLSPGQFARYEAIRADLRQRLEAWESSQS